MYTNPNSSSEWDRLLMGLTVPYSLLPSRVCVFMQYRFPQHGQRSIACQYTKKGSKEDLRQNPLGNWVILIFSGKKPCTRIIQRKLHSFLHFSRAITPKIISYECPKMKYNDKFHKITSYTIIKFSEFYLWNLTFTFSGCREKFSLVLLQMTNYIFSPWKM